MSAAKRSRSRTASRARSVAPRSCTRSHLLSSTAVAQPLSRASPSTLRVLVGESLGRIGHDERHLGALERTQRHQRARPLAGAIAATAAAQSRSVDQHVGSVGSFEHGVDGVARGPALVGHHHAFDCRAGGSPASSCRRSGDPRRRRASPRRPRRPLRRRPPLPACGKSSTISSSTSHAPRPCSAEIPRTRSKPESVEFRDARLVTRRVDLVHHAARSAARSCAARARSLRLRAAVRLRRPRRRGSHRRRAPPSAPAPAPRRRVPRSVPARSPRCRPSRCAVPRLRPIARCGRA